MTRTTSGGGDAPLPGTSTAAAFLALHSSERPLLQPNAWDIGSARILASLGFKSLATTSSGRAAALGRLDGTVSRAELLEHAEELVRAVTIPVAVDAENGFADDPVGVAETVRMVAATGVAGCSIEDFSGVGIYDIGHAVERIAAAAEAAHAGPATVVLTARAENHIHGRDNLDDTIRRLQAFEEAGADVLFAPGLRSLDQIRTVVSAVDVPVNVLALPGCPTIEELANVGVARVSVGGAFAFAAYAGLVDAARELAGRGTYGYWDAVRGSRDAILAALS